MPFEKWASHGCLLFSILSLSPPQITMKVPAEFSCLLQKCAQTWSLFVISKPVVLMGTHSQSKKASSSQITYMNNTFPFYSRVLCMLCVGEGWKEGETWRIITFPFTFY